MTVSATPSPLVDVDWLADHMNNPGVVILDGSWYLPSASRNPAAEFERERIPGARFFDIERISDPHTDLPHMLPSAMEFGDAVAQLGVLPESTVVVYDTAGLFSAARVWWMFRAYGHERVFVLNGGLPRWLAAGGAVDRGVPVPPESAEVPYPAELDTRWLASHQDVVTAVEQKTAVIVDARAAERFNGSAPEPRPGLRSGHMPGAVNLPFGECLVADKTGLRPAAELEALFRERGIPEGPVVTSCGSGITACVLSLALALLGRESRVYDGSWAEWGGRSDSLIVTEP